MILRWSKTTTGSVAKQLHVFNLTQALRPNNLWSDHPSPPSRSRRRFSSTEFGKERHLSGPPLKLLFSHDRPRMDSWHSPQDSLQGATCVIREGVFRILVQDRHWTCWLGWHGTIPVTRAVRSLRIEGWENQVVGKEINVCTHLDPKWDTRNLSNSIKFNPHHPPNQIDCYCEHFMFSSTISGLIIPALPPDHADGFLRLSLVRRDTFQVLHWNFFSLMTGQEWILDILRRIAFREQHAS